MPGLQSAVGKEQCRSRGRSFPTEPPTSPLYADRKAPSTFGFSQNTKNRECNCYVLMNMFSYYMQSLTVFSKPWLFWSTVFLDSKKPHTFSAAIFPTKYQACSPMYTNKRFLVLFWATFFAFRQKRKRQPVPGIKPGKFTPNQVKTGKIKSN